MTDWKTLKEKYAKFRQWQQTPHTVAPMPDVEHDCFTCGTHFTGNYCPRCGQSARIGRFSFKSALLLYVDVWGLGNRGMFRNIRDLILRPGYMIRDYLSGIRTENGKEEPTGLPTSNVLFFELEKGNWVCVRPSGTEPKIKLYVNSNAADQASAEALNAKLCAASKALMA